MAINVNGVTLPDVPSEWLETRQYAVILSDGSSYSCVTATEIFFAIPNANTLASWGQGYGGGYITTDASGALAWQESSEITSSNYFINTLGAEIQLVWSNHDVCEADEDGNILDTIYFPSSVVAEPEYGKIRRQIVRDIANSIRSKTGNTAKLTPEQMAEEIDSIVTADGLPNAEEYSFGGSASEYGMDITTNKFNTSLPSERTASNFFRANTDLTILGLRVMAPSTNVIAYLWDGAGNQLTYTWITGKGYANGWVEQLLETPVVIPAGSEFVVGVWTGWNQQYGTKTDFNFNSAITYLRYGVAVGKGFPTTTYTSGEVASVDIIIGSSASLPETYQISLARLNRLANAVKTVTGNSNAMTVEEIISAVESVATATAEE